VHKFNLFTVRLWLEKRDPDLPGRIFRGPRRTMAAMARDAVRMTGHPLDEALKRGWKVRAMGPTGEIE